MTPIAEGNLDILLLPPEEADIITASRSIWWLILHLLRNGSDVSGHLSVAVGEELFKIQFTSIQGSPGLSEIGEAGNRPPPPRQGAPGVS